MIAPTNPAVPIPRITTAIPIPHFPTLTTTAPSNAASATTEKATANNKSKEQLAD